MIVISAQIKAKEGNGDELEAVIKKYAPQFLQDEGCLAYAPNRRLDNPLLFFFYEKYENEEALKAHGASATFKEMSGAMRPFVDGRPEICMYREI